MIHEVKLNAIDWATAHKNINAASKNNYVARSLYHQKGYEKEENEDVIMYVKFLASDAYNRKKFLQIASFRIYVQSVNVVEERCYVDPWVWFNGITSKWNADQVTYYNQPKSSNYSQGVYMRSSGWVGAIDHSVFESLGEENIINNGIKISLTQENFTYPGAPSMYYFASSRMLISTPNTANAPYLVLKYEDLIPWVEEVMPNAGYINAKISNTFSWNFAVDTGAKVAPKQASYKIEWKNQGDSFVNEVLGTSQSSHTFLADTFGSPNKIEWRVMVTSDDGLSSEWTNWAVLSTVNLGAAAIPKAPFNTYFYQGEPITFEWEHATPTGTGQTGFEIQANEGDAWVTLHTGNGSQNSYIMPKGKAWAKDDWQWRVRTKNQTGAWGVGRIL